MDQSERNCAKLTAILAIGEFKPASHFRLYDSLGRGTQGIGVFKAQDKATGQKYAAKVFQIRREYVIYAQKTNSVTDDSTVLAFVREFRAIKEFKHANVVKYFFLDVSVDKSLENYQLRVFMERCTGDTLERDLGKVYQKYQTGYKSADVHRHFLDLLSGLDYLHHRQIVHRDLRPENLIFAEPEKKTLKIADYSAAVMLNGTITEPGEVTTSGGPPWQYKAPEVANPAKFGDSGRRTDVWSMACILIFMLQGKAPVFRYASGRNIIVAESNADVQKALENGVAPYIDGDFQRKARYGDEGAFLNLARDLLQRCLVAHNKDRPYIDAVGDHSFISYKPKNHGSWF